VSKSNEVVRRETRVDAIAKLLPKDDREHFYRLMAHLHDVQPDDEILQIVEAMGFLGLLIGKAPAEVAAEREKLEKLLLQQAPGAMAAERKELSKILSSSVSQMEEAAKKTAQYHAQLESRLTKLPEAIVNGISPEGIACSIGESMRQHLVDTGINRTVQGMYTMAQQMKQAAGTMHDAAAAISDDQRGVLPKLDAALRGMEANLEDATQRVVQLSGTLRAQARPWLPWGVVATLLVIIVLGMIMVFYTWPSEASRTSIHVDPNTLVQLPSKAGNLMPTLREKERQISQLEDKVKELEAQVAAGFCSDVGYQDDGYFDALVRMFGQALKLIAQLSASDRNPLIARLDRVRIISHSFGYGVGDDMDSLLAKYVRD